MTNTKARDTNYKKMTTAPIPTLVLSLAFPTIISSMVTALYNIVDTFFVSQISTSASAAVGVIFPVMTIIQAIGLMLGHGCASYISRLLGKKDKDGATRYGTTSFCVALVLGFSFSIIGLFNLESLVNLLGATETIAPYAIDYARYILIAVPFTTVSFVLNATLRANGHAMRSMVGISVGAAINVVLDPFFIFYLNLGISGAAIATALSQFISFSVLVYFCFGKKIPAPLNLKKLPFDIKYLLDIMKVGLPSFYRQGLNAIALLLLNLITRQFGDVAIASISITSRIFQFVFFCAVGFGQGFQTVCGFNYGAKLYDRVKQAYIFSLKTLSTALLLAAVAMFVFSDEIITAFRKDDAELIALGSATLLYFSFSIPILPTIILCNMCCQSIGKNVFSSLIAILQNGVFLISFILIFPNFLGVMGCQISMPVAQILTFFVAVPITVYLFKIFDSKAALLR